MSEKAKRLQESISSIISKTFRCLLGIKFDEKEMKGGDRELKDNRNKVGKEKKMNFSRKQLPHYIRSYVIGAM